MMLSPQFGVAVGVGVGVSVGVAVARRRRRRGARGRDGRRRRRGRGLSGQCSGRRSASGSPCPGTTVGVAVRVGVGSRRRRRGRDGRRRSASASRRVALGRIALERRNPERVDAARLEPDDAAGRSRRGPEGHDRPVADGAARHDTIGQSPGKPIVVGGEIVAATAARDRGRRRPRRCHDDLGRARFSLSCVLVSGHGPADAVQHLVLALRERLRACAARPSHAACRSRLALVERGAGRRRREPVVRERHRLVDRRVADARDAVDDVVAIGDRALQVPLSKFGQMTDVPTDRGERIVVTTDAAVAVGPPQRWLIVRRSLPARRGILPAGAVGTRAGVLPITTPSLHFRSSLTFACTNLRELAVDGPRHATGSADAPWATRR